MKTTILVVAALFVLAACRQAPVPAAPLSQAVSESNECLTSEAYAPVASPTPRPFVTEDQAPSPTAAALPGASETPTPYPTPIPTPTVTNALETLPMASASQLLDDRLTLIGEWTPEYSGGFRELATGQIAGNDYALMMVGDDYRLFQLRPNEPPVQTNVLLDSPPGRNHEIIWSGRYLAIRVQTGLDDAAYFYEFSDEAEPCLVGVNTGVRHVLALDNGYAFVETDDETSSYPQYVILDVDDPENVKAIELGDPELSDYVWSAASRDGLLYVTSWDRVGPRDHPKTRLDIIDMSDPGNITTVGHIERPAGSDGIYGDETVVLGDYVYLMVGGMAIRIIDVSDPSQPVQVGLLPPDKRETHMSGGIIEPAGMIVDGTRLYALSWGGDWGVYRWRLLAVDISDPASPQEIGRFEGRSFANGMWLQGSEISVVDTFGITVIDTSDLASLRQTNRIPSPYGAKAVHLRDSKAALFFGSGIFSLDIEDPSSPRLMNFRYDGPIQVVNQAIDSEQAGDLFGFRINGVSKGYEFDASALPDLVVKEIEDRVMPNNPSRAPYVYNALCGALLVEDETRDAQNSQVARLRLANSWCGEGWDADLFGDFAYVTGNGSLYVLDISNPAAPSLLSEKPLIEDLEDENQSSILIEGDLAYVLHGGLWILDLENPEDPREIAHYSTNAHVLDIDGDRIGLLGLDGVFQLLRFDR